MAQLPGIGKRTALRLVLHLLKQPVEQTQFLSQALTTMREEIKFCKSCHNISDVEVCEICNNSARNHKIICVVEDIRDVMAIESTSTYNGMYHVLGGLISPMDGIGPQALNIASLPVRIERDQPKEIILALSPTMEGDTTNFYIFKKIKVYELLVTRISRGIAVGSELQYADELTLGRSLQQRQIFDLQQ